MKKYEFTYTTKEEPETPITLIIEAEDSMDASAEFLKEKGKDLQAVWGLRRIEDEEQCPNTNR